MCIPDMDMMSLIRILSAVYAYIPPGTTVISEERLPRKVVFGEMLGGTGYSGGREWD